jgi:hypothetical protein
MAAPFHLTPLDRHILSLSDDQFQPHSWADLKAIIGTDSPTAHLQPYN